ncbi:peptidyl-tRNA hydrolase [Veillonella montpellierensis DNF00314]|uniref:Peptidyl-tRNA hydrolase n=1 Tax=Veillonella montpellierensis DNF00314 TaxID=1401067 RepID=A0A096AHY8_9FIRM|nr:aminoacyl-tRNA hydrolase [Veillonella montpellierensis]KGF46723.1 peptidyl-tRNA hydrolase [Veillonella montpellierensis DNF00314]
MKLVVGLGNPGKQYEATKHNVGFMVIDEIASTLSHTPWREEKKADVCTSTVAREKVLLVKPQTFMNNSGEAVGPLMRYYKIDPADVYCIYDDMDLPVGKLRIRPNGSAGGHNGIKSLILHLGTEEFPRFRVGIGRPLPKWTVVDHVLSPFTEEQEQIITEGVTNMAKAVLGTIEVGIDKGMNLYNPKKGKRHT